MKNLVLIGYRGTGKTEVSKALSQKLGINVISIDEEFIKKKGMKISSFVNLNGWEAFRDIEHGLIKKFSRLNDAIIDTGGGAVLNEENVKNLKKNGILFLLKANVNTIKKRIQKSKDRPPLTDSKSTIDEIETVLKQREEKYNQAADYTIKTGLLLPEEVAEKILKIFRRC